jgi:hypothetical protein
VAVTWQYVHDERLFFGFIEQKRDEWLAAFKDPATDTDEVNRLGAKLFELYGFVQLILQVEASPDPLQRLKAGQPNQLLLEHGDWTAFYYHDPSPNWYWLAGVLVTYGRDPADLLARTGDLKSDD